MGVYAVTKNASIQTYAVDSGVTPVAGADDIARYRLVKLVTTGDHSIEYAEDALAQYAGVTMCGGDIGALLDVHQNGGVAIVEAGGAITVGDPIIATTGGKAATGAGYSIGQALTAAAADGDLIAVAVDQTNS